MRFPTKIYENIVQNYMHMFGTNTKLYKSVRSPLEQGYHIDIDT